MIICALRGRCYVHKIDVGRKFSITIHCGPFTYEILLGLTSDWKVLMVAQDGIGLRHREHGARCLAPQYMLFGRLSSNLSFKAQKGK